MQVHTLDTHCMHIGYTLDTHYIYIGYTLELYKDIFTLNMFSACGRGKFIIVFECRLVYF